MAARKNEAPAKAAANPADPRDDVPAGDVKPETDEEREKRADAEAKPEDPVNEKQQVHPKRAEIRSILAGAKAMGREPTHPELVRIHRLESDLRAEAE